METSDPQAYLEAMLSAPRPGADRILAFYDHRVGRICTDARLLFVALGGHLCHRGDGLFESICCRERRVFALDAHLARMREGAAALSLTPPCPWGEIRERILDVARAGDRDHCDLRVFLSRGPGGFGISPAECPVAWLYLAPARRGNVPEGAFGLCQRHPAQAGISGAHQEHQLSPQCLHGR